MKKIEIGRPRIEDIEMINEFFEIVLRDTFERNGISDMEELIIEEIESKKNFLKQDLESGGKNRYFLIAKEEDKIVGSIEYGTPNELIISSTNGKLKDLVEIGTVFVRPEYQSKGIGSQLIMMLCEELRKSGRKEFCLDSGYKTAQKTWTKKLGEPEYILKDYWGEGDDHMIWRVKL
jgi:predicted N-acetyltransferase YhbS